MREDSYAIRETRATPHEAKGADLDACAQRRAILHNGRRVDPRHQPGIGGGPEARLCSVSIALYSASAHGSSPTKALPSKRHTGPRWRRTRTGRRSGEPGWTGRRKRALSMVMK